MALKRFTTNTRLWLVVSLVLFVPPWFIGNIDNHDEMPASGLWILLFTDPLNLGAVVGGIFACILFFGIPALAAGWVLHCMIIIVADFIKGRRRDAG